jgi:diacylglycerol kinase family enzyme
MENLEAIKQKLAGRNYMVTIPAGASHISVMGYNKKYFNAKQAKAATIAAELRSQGFRVVIAKAGDGYFDFYVYAN